MRVPVQIVPAAQHSAGAIGWTLGTVYTPRLVYGAPLRISSAGRSASEFDRWVTLFLQDSVYALMQRAWQGFPIPEQTYKSQDWDVLRRAIAAADPDAAGPEPARA